MLSLEPEIRVLHREGLLDDDAARRLIALERRDLFSVHAEIRFLFWAAVSLVVASAGFVLKEYADRLGPPAIIGLVAVLAVACYSIAWRIVRREQMHAEAGRAIAVSEYVVLLGALLLSTDAGYAETRYHLLGEGWSRHLLILAVVHGVAAYLYASRLVLGASIASLAGWLGIERDAAFLLRDEWFAGERLLVAAIVLLGWRFAHGRVTGRLETAWRSRLAPFAGILEHTAVNLGMIGALSWVFDDAMEWAGLYCLGLLVAGSIVAGIRRRRGAFVVYGFLYGLIGIDAIVIRRIDQESLALLYLLVTTPIAIAALVFVHRRWRVE